MVDYIKNNNTTNMLIIKLFTGVTYSVGSGVLSGGEAFFDFHKKKTFFSNMNENCIFLVVITTFKMIQS